MARARKGARHITVDDVTYCWRASSLDDFISIASWPEDAGRPTLTARLHDGRVEGENPPGRNHQSARTLVMTNRIVRRLLKLAGSAHGHDPSVNGSSVHPDHVEMMIDVADAIVADNKHW